MTSLGLAVEQVCVRADQTLRDVIRTIQQGGALIALVVDDDFHLLGTITDGDVRRAILDGVTMEASASSVMHKQYTAGHVDMSEDDILRLMVVNKVRHIPLLDDAGRLVDVMRLPAHPSDNDVNAMIMAGGYGRRLLPLTEDMPKPMLHLGDRPIMEHLIDQLRQAGISTVNIATHYLQEKISEYFGAGERFGVNISYVSEQEPLGTAGAIGLLDKLEGPLLVVNGDIVTGLDLQAMLSYHREHEAELTVAVRHEVFKLPYAVVNCSGSDVQRIVEKPSYQFLVNAGIYLLEPRACNFIPSNQAFDMTDLIDHLLEAKKRVVSFPVHEYWLDVGQKTHYEQAVEDFRTGAHRLPTA